MGIEEDTVDVLARTAWGEARGEGRTGMIAVINVVINRVKSRKWPNDIMSVCQQALQFSCWNANDPNRSKLISVTMANPTFLMAMELAQSAIKGELADITNGANHYHEQSIMPFWAKGRSPVATIGRHRFYKFS